MERSEFLQLMRFVAAALVLITHATFYYHERVSSAFAVWHFGEVGVPIFFVISGIVMVVSTQTLPSDASGAKAFMLRRIVRVVPLWWLALGVKVVIGTVRPDLVNHNHVEAIDAVRSFLFIPYFNEAHQILPLHGVGWTLLHEMFFYVVFSLVMLCGLRPALAASAVIILLWLSGGFVSIDNPFWAVATSAGNLHFVLGMFVGSVLSRSPSRGLPWLRQATGLLLGLACLATLIPVLSASFQPSESAILAFASATLLLGAVAMPPVLSALVRLGDSSYSLYLFHPFVAPASLLVLTRFAPDLGAPTHIAFAVCFTIAVAHVLHLTIEAPMVRFARSLVLGPPRIAAAASSKAL